eukprot:TRINITY_DN12395_c0_g1_i1.p1 TRINITY_DN12395_c0_g1~~TRINITY_DN12395_c0_g1_i1.p1  ORF type:complete len:235 (-),score=42.23 TRINITY_DN12395_c0_g1_i1:171-875(-)
MTDGEIIHEKVHGFISDDASNASTDSTADSDHMDSISTDSESEPSMRPRAMSLLFAALALEPSKMSLRKHGHPSGAPVCVGSTMMQGSKRRQTMSKADLGGKKRQTMIDAGVGGKKRQTMSDDGVGCTDLRRFVPEDLLRRPDVRMQRHRMLVDPSSRHDIILNAMYEVPSKISSSQFVLSGMRDLSGSLIEGLHGFEVWPAIVPRANICLKGTIWDARKPSKHNHASSSRISL